MKLSMFPDLIFINGSIHTQDIDHPRVQAVAVTGERISATGTTREILSLAGDTTRVVDLDQKLMIPGFTDVHFHFFEWALNHDSIDLSSAASLADLEAMVTVKAEAAGPGNWVLGQGFYEEAWPENRLPLRSDLDRAAPENPVCIWRCDLHMAVANSMALELAGITAETPDPAAGVIVKDSAGNPNGILRELASNLVRVVLPEPDEAQILAVMEDRFSALHACGITGIHDIRLMGGLDGSASLRAWQKLREGNKLKVRCHVALPGEMTDEAIALGLRTGFGDDLLRIGHLKFFADGGMGARTAWMNEPYLDGGSGMPLTPIADIEAALVKADKAGLSIMVHAIGSRANRELVMMFERLERSQKTGTRVPHRIEHVQMIETGDLDRMGRLSNVAAACQPNNLSLDVSMIDGCVGDLGRYAYPLKGLIDREIPLMFSSDAPVCNPNPLAGIYSAVNRTRMDHTPDGGWYMEQALDIDEAVRAYTLTPAVASGVGEVSGSISPGKFADMVVLERNIYDIDPRQVLETGVAMTVFNGSIVYSRQEVPKD